MTKAKGTTVVSNTTNGDKATTPRNRRLETDFYGPKSLLSANKVRRVLTLFDVDTAKFSEAYLATTGRPQIDITPERRTAIEKFNTGTLTLEQAQEAVGYKTELAFLQFRERVMSSK
jgi:hypothetical protein